LNDKRIVKYSGQISVKAFDVVDINLLETKVTFETLNCRT